jgi:hypothetical protein
MLVAYRLAGLSALETYYAVSERARKPARQRRTARHIRPLRAVGGLGRHRAGADGVSAAPTLRQPQDHIGIGLARAAHGGEAWRRRRGGWRWSPRPSSYRFDKDELKTDLGNGARSAASAFKMPGQQLLGVRPIEPVWVSPHDYETSNPLKPNWYKPNAWHADSDESAML